MKPMNEDAQSHKSKKGFHTFPRRERGIGMDAGGFLDEVRESPTAGHSRICQAFEQNQNPKTYQTMV